MTASRPARNPGHPAIMLTHLQIRDFAIAEAVEIEFDSGFTVLTGETGAGKSILVDALLLAVGGRADSGAVRHGAERAEVSATFAVANNTAALGWLEEQSIAHDGECQLRRVVGVDGRGRAYLNGQSVPVQSLRALGELLVDVHGQLEFQSLSRKGYQRATLDGSGKLGALVAEVRATYATWRAADQERTTFEQRSRDRDARLDLLRHYATELDALDPKPQEAEIARRRTSTHCQHGAAGRRYGTDRDVAGRRRRRCGRRAGTSAVRIAATGDARRETGTDGAVARGGQHCVSRGPRQPASLRRCARVGSRQAGMGRSQAGGPRSRRAQASRRGRTTARPARASRSRAWRTRIECVEPRRTGAAPCRRTGRLRRGRAQAQRRSPRRCQLTRCDGHRTHAGTRHARRRLCSTCRSAGSAGVFRERQRRCRVHGQRESGAADPCAGEGRLRRRTVTHQPGVAGRGGRSRAPAAASCSTKSTRASAARWPRWSDDSYARWPRMARCFA